ncbi:hypothetical protein, partial [Rheinheimera soli]|uniref:hypothetical protein n=1 Tax=Rheinheimera soli TaxID=443616 RepID=UPI001E63E358
MAKTALKQSALPCILKHVSNTHVIFVCKTINYSSRSAVTGAQQIKTSLPQGEVHVTLTADQMKLRLLINANRRSS